MKKDIKQWVLSKKKSFTDMLVPPRTDSSKENIDPNETGGTPTDMDIDTKMDSSNKKLPTKSNFSVRGSQFRVDVRYSYIKTLGVGAYGLVCAAADKQTGRRVAVKKVAGVFDDLTDAKRIIREIRLLRCMSHDNVLSVLDIDEPEHYSSFNDVYIVTELMDTDLCKLLRSSADLLDSQRKFFTYHLLRALKYIHSANIMHRDLKPANILVSETCDIKICDFGLARYVDPVEAPNQNMTEYVVTRWYRAPELLLAHEEYTCAIDMWSTGCILAELYYRRPLFPGSDVKNQLEHICKILGKPTSEEIDSIPNKRARDFVHRLPQHNKIELQKLMTGADAHAVDLAERLLKFDPSKRITATQALDHPYVGKYRDAKSETTAQVIDGDELEPPSEKKVGRDGIRRLMWDEILKFHPAARDREPAAAKEAEHKLQSITRRV